ncbi:hypothetical protein BJV77DRAFT_1023244 [Russula vinacea]|nr:hypothetical protein BJV77DRAFT_1023244 [Russula vinacea]
MKTEIKNEDDVEASFRAGLSQFAHQPSSQSQSSSSTRRLLRRYGPPPIPKTSPPPPPTVAVAAPPQPPSVKMDVDPDDDDGTRTGLGRSRVSARTRKRVGERLNTGGARPSKKMKKNKTGAHGARQLKVVSDHLAEDLDVLFCGINPGKMSALSGHHYANPSNHFWYCLHHAGTCCICFGLIAQGKHKKKQGFTPTLLPAAGDFSLPESYNLGLTNLVERPSTSEADLSSQEMASSVSVLLAKVARYRPRVLCFIGKGIWLHVERSLERNLLPKNDGSDDGIVTGSGAVVVPKREEEESPPMMIKADPDTPTKTKWPAVKAEEGVATFGASTSTAADSSSLDTGRALRSSSTVTMTVGRGSVAPARATPKKAAARPVFAYGLQPYKAVHEVIPKVATVRETLFCVFPSTSGRVVSHQRKDKVALFKVLKENLEHIRAGDLDTSSMQLVRLVRQES